MWVAQHHTPIIPESVARAPSLDRHVGARLRGPIPAAPRFSVLMSKCVFEVSVDAHTKGRKLDSYRRHRVGEGLRVLVDNDLHRLSVEVLVVTGRLFGRSLDARIDGIDGAPCPIHILR